MAEQIKTAWPSNQFTLTGFYKVFNYKTSLHRWTSSSVRYRQITDTNSRCLVSELLECSPGFGWIGGVTKWLLKIQFCIIHAMENQDSNTRKSFKICFATIARRPSLVLALFISNIDLYFGESLNQRFLFESKV